MYVCMYVCRQVLVITDSLLLLVCVYVCACVRMYVCMYVCMHVTVQDVADRIDAGKLLTAITLENAPAECVHGTYLKAWERIKTEGLSRMTRQHMHFTDSLTKKEGQQQVSGFRSSCNVLIYVDLQRAIAAGVRFFRAANGVILTEGHDGLLTPEFFSKVTDRDGIEMTV